MELKFQLSIAHEVMPKVEEKPYSDDVQEGFELELPCHTLLLDDRNILNDGLNSNEDHEDHAVVEPLVSVDILDNDVSVRNATEVNRYFHLIFVKCRRHSLLLLSGVLIGATAALVAIQTGQTEKDEISKCVYQSNNGGVSWKQYMEYAKQLNETQRCDESRTAHCVCMDYTKPEYPTDWRERMWLDAFHEHLERVQQYLDSGSPPLDVVMLGDSITEHWLGTDLGVPNPQFEDIVPWYERLFQPEHGADISGLAFGIGGDRCPHLLYRVENGMMSDALQPSVWWLLIGTNDVGGEYCREEVVVSGIILIAETIHKLRPDATVVINSLLPRGNERRMGFWGQHSNINHALACYTEGKDRVEFYNATSLFMQRDGITINGSLLEDELHPNALGAAVWGEAIVERVKDIVRGNN